MYHVMWTGENNEEVIGESFGGLVNYRVCHAEKHLSNVLKKHFGDTGTIQRRIKQGSLKIIKGSEEVVEERSTPTYHIGETQLIM